MFRIICAKQLLPVAGKPVLFYALEEMRAAGMCEVVVVVGETAPQIMAAVGDGSSWGLAVHYARQAAPLGLAHAVAAARPLLGEEPFLLQLGDNLIPGGLSRLAEHLWEGAAAGALVAPVAEPARYGIAVVEGSRVVRLVEKPAAPPGNLALIGAYAFQPEIFAAIDRLAPSERGELEITDAIQGLVTGGATVQAMVWEGWWCDAGTPDDLLAANRWLLERMAPADPGELEGSSVQGSIHVGPGSRVVDSTLCGPVWIGEDCEVVGATLGPFVAVGDGATLHRVRVEDSMILPGATILCPTVTLRRSIIGRGALLTGPAGPGGLALVIGDQCRLSGL